MSYLMIDDFAAGIDQRKSAVTAPPGTLRTLANAVITPGGEIEKRKTFSSLGALPAGDTHGLAFDGTDLVVFGTIAPGSVGTLPSYVVYQQLVIADAETIVRVLDVQNFTSKIYVIAEFSDGSNRHFYDGAQVPTAEVDGTRVRAHNTKLYAADGNLCRISAIKDPLDWTVGTGFGLIDITQEDVANTDLVGLEKYYSFLALFGRTSIQIWAMDVDPAANGLYQTLGNIGLVAPGALARFGNGDVLFLSDTGIRSLRARDGSDSASINDVGAPLDAVIAERRSILTPEDAAKIEAIVDPLTGRFWLAWGKEIFILSTFPKSKVSAWSLFQVGTTIDHIALANSRIVTRHGEDILMYGTNADGGSNPFDPNTPLGLDAANYDATSVTIETPFMDAKTPATNKVWTGLDLSCEGEWDVYVNPDYNSPDTWTKIATVTEPTWIGGRIPIDMESTHLAVKLVSTGTGPAKIASMALHYSGGETS